jgi:hypothetical protein
MRKNAKYKQLMSTVPKKKNGLKILSGSHAPAWKPDKERFLFTAK